MKKGWFLLCVGCWCMAVSCSRHSQERLLQERIEAIWRLSDSSLDDAVRMAGGMKDSMEEVSGYTRNKFDLLCIRLRDKQYMMPTSADSVKQAVRYFKRHGSKTDLMRAYYYMGSVYCSLHDSPRAIENVLLAVELAEKGLTADTMMLMKCYSLLTDLSYKQLNYEAALKHSLKCYEIGNKAGLLDAWYIMDVAKSYHALNDTMQEFAYANRAFELIKRDGWSVQEVAPLAFMLSVYCRAHDDVHADSIVSVLHGIPITKRPHNYDLTFGHYYKSKGQTDSAAVYYQRVFDYTRRVASRCDAAKELMAYYAEKGDYRRATEYAMAYQEANDSTIRERQFELTRNAQGAFLYQRNKAAEEEAMRRSRRIQEWSIVGGGLCIMAVLAFMAYSNYRKKRLLEVISGKTTEIGNAKAQIELQEQELRTRNEELTAKSYELTVMNEKLAEAKRKLAESEQELAVTMENLKVRISHNDELMRIALSGRAVANAPEVVEKCKRAAVGRETLTDEQWKDLFAAVDTLYPTFRTTLQSKIRFLREPLLRTAYLLQIGLSTTEISKVMETAPQTAWNRVKRIETALGIVSENGISAHGKPGSPVG